MQTPIKSQKKGGEMPQSITAVYEQGVLRPLEPLSLPENQKVRIRIDMEKQKDLGGNVFQFLIDIGRLTPPSGQSKVNPIPLAKRNRAADILGQAAKKPVSEIIIEDRGER
jgi:predicted DNA-binding antitoxin AbrB/MazE fold protein